jgi:hypothetical protein
MFNIFFQEPTYENIYKKFIESNEDNIIENIENIKKFILDKKISNIDELKDEITLKTNIYSHNKSIISSLKALSILINKTYYNNTILLKKINYLIKISNQKYENQNQEKSNEYSKKLKYIIHKLILQINESKQQCSSTFEILESILLNDTDNHILKGYPHILFLINVCKSRFPSEFINSPLEHILYKCNSRIYDYIFFLKSLTPINTKDATIQLLTNYNFEQINNQLIDNMELKRGFIQEFKKNDKNYILKYQPNRSIMEIVLNVYLKSITKKSEMDAFLFPDYFFINNDRSYCYVIEKYDIDLYKYFNILSDNNTIFTLTDILHILRFILKSIKFMFQNNIIHGDIKLENIVLNYEITHSSIPIINTLKLIDFDVSLFNSIPERLNPIPDEFKKTFNNKKVRGTKIYMLNDTFMSFKNDIYSLGVVLLIILFKNIKLLISIKKNALDQENSSNKKIILRYNTLIKRLNTLRSEIDIYDNKLKIINLIKEFIDNSSSLNFFTTINDKLRFSILLDLIKDCIKTKYDIEELEDKYQSIINQELS